MKIKFSIITINYNNFLGLQRTVRSVVNQSWKEFEYIVIDGGSIDGSKEYLETHGQLISYWRSEPDAGIYNAMNKGIKASAGEYILFLNSGDEFINNTILENVNHMIHTQDLVYFDLLFIFQEKEIIQRYPETLNYNFMINSSLGHPSTFIKKKLFDKIGMYDESLNIVSDWKFFSLALIRHKCSHKKVNVVLSKFYKDGISTEHPDLVREERQKVLNQDFPEYLRLIELEDLIKKIRKSTSVKWLQKIGFFKILKKV